VASAGVVGEGRPKRHSRECRRLQCLHYFRFPVICAETYKSRFLRDRGVAEMVGKDTGAASANEKTTRIEVLQ
jgi:hypothetical protein